jgi:hypothetical protein
MLEFSEVADALDAMTGDDTEAVIVITASEDNVIVRAFGSRDAVTDALHAALRGIDTSPHRPRDLRPN